MNWFSATHTKFLVALIGAVTIAANNYIGVIIPWTPVEIVDVVVAILTMFGVERVTNA